MSVTWNDDVTVAISLSASPVPRASFGTTLFMDTLTGSSLNGLRMATYGTLAAVQTDVTAGYVSAAGLAAATAAFAQRPQPNSFKISNTDRTLVAALHTTGVWSGGGDGKFDATITAVAPGQAGNNITLRLVSAGAESCTVIGTAITVNFNAGVSTVTTIKTLINGTPAAAALVTANAGTGATVLIAASAFTATPLAGGSGETWAEGFAAAVAYDAAFYAVTTSSRVGADQAVLGAAVAATERLFFFQSSDAAILTGVFPTALAAIQTSDQCIGLYHDTAAQYLDVALPTNRLVYDPDVQSASWHCKVNGVTPYATAVTLAQRNFARDTNKFNLLDVYGGELTFVKNGVTLSNKPIYMILSAHWLSARVKEDIEQLDTDHAARGQKLTVDLTGQAKILGLIRARLAQGIATGHFVAGNTTAAGVTITDADRAARILRFTGTMQIAQSTIYFNLSFAFTTSALAAA